MLTFFACSVTVLAVPLYLQTRYGSISWVSQRSTRPAGTGARATIWPGGPSYKAALFNTWRTPESSRLAGHAIGAANAAPLVSAQNSTQRLLLDHIELISVVGFHSVSVSKADCSFVDGLHCMSVPLIQNLNADCIAAKINGCMTAAISVVSVPTVRVECGDNRSWTDEIRGSCFCSPMPRGGRWNGNNSMYERHALSVADKLSFKRICLGHICNIKHSLPGLFRWLRYPSTPFRVDSGSQWAHQAVQSWFHISTLRSGKSLLFR